MKPTSIISQQIVELIASDPTTLAEVVGGVKVHLIVAPFTPGPGVDLAGLTEASWTGYAALAAGTGAQQVLIDPATQLRNVQLLEPAGGWHFPCTAGPVPAQTVYGYCVTKNDGSETYGSELLPTPQVINGAGQAIDLPYIRFTFLGTSPF